MGVHAHRRTRTGGPLEGYDALILGNSAVMIHDHTRPGVLTIRLGRSEIVTPHILEFYTHSTPVGGGAQVREANQMVEEMMLMANVSVATHILKHYPLWSLLRCFPAPSSAVSHISCASQPRPTPQRCFQLSALHD